MRKVMAALFIILWAVGAAVNTSAKGPYSSSGASANGTWPRKAWRSRPATTRWTLMALFTFYHRLL